MPNQNNPTNQPTNQPTNNNNNNNKNRYFGSLNATVASLGDLAVAIEGAQLDMLAALNEVEGVVDNATATADTVAQVLLSAAAFGDLTLTQALTQGIESVGVGVLVMYFALGFSVVL